MAYVPIKPEELKKLVLMGKKRPMNMAFNPGPKDDDLLIIHKIKAADVLGRTAKKEGEGPKVAFGSFEISGKTLTLNAVQTVPGLAKKLRKYFKKMEFSFKVEVLDSQGNLIDEDAEEETPQPAAPSSPQAQSENDTAQPDPAHAALTDRLRALKGDVPSGSAPLQKALATVAKLIKEGSVDKASDGLDRIEAAVRQAAAASATQTTRQAEGSEPDAKALTARAASLRAVLNTLERGGAERIKILLVQSLTSLQSGDFHAAQQTLEEAENTLNALPPEPEMLPQGQAPAPSKAQGQWEKTLPRLQAQVDAAMNARRGDLAAINRAFEYAKSQAEAGNFDSALKSAATTVGLLRDAATSTAEARVANAAEAAVHGGVDYTASRLMWLKTRAKMHADLVKLKMAIDQHASTTAGLEGIAQNTGVLLEYIEEIDTSLEATLDALVETPDGQTREALKQEATRIIATYRSTLDSEFFKAVDDNGFTQTAIRGTALEALAQVETALTA